MTVTPLFVDIHCHLLPGLDDGPATWDVALKMARTAAADGIHTVIATPHQLGRYRQNSAEMIRNRVCRLQQVLQHAQIPLRVLPGADVRIDDTLIDQLRNGHVVTLGDCGKHVLLELPHDVYIPLDFLIRTLRTMGLVGILSHPERNTAIQKNPTIVKHLMDAGCLIQVTADSLLGFFGKRARDLTERWLVGGKVHFVSTDAHGPERRKPVLSHAFQRTRQLAGRAAARQLFCTNPGLVAAGHRVATQRDRPVRVLPACRAIWKAVRGRVAA